jgi:hypothetical protein
MAANQRVPNRLAKEMVDPLVVRCANSALADNDGGDEGEHEPVAKRQKGADGSAAPAAAASCLWQGPTKDAAAHASVCTFFVTCDVCQGKSSVRALAMHKAMMCPRRPAQCPNDGCDEIVSFDKMWFHKGYSCEYQVIRCQFKACPCEFQRREQQVHDEECATWHLKMTVERLDEVIDANSDTAHELAMAKTDIKSAEDNIELLEAANDALEEAHDARGVEIGELKEEATELAERVDTNETEISELQDEASERDDAIKELKKKASERDGAIKEPKKSLKKMATTTVILWLKMKDGKIEAEPKKVYIEGTQLELSCV